MADEERTDTEAPQGQRELAPAALPSGSGFRAAIKAGDDIVWWCPHVHFTEHSAKNCPAQRAELSQRHDA